MDLKLHTADHGRDVAVITHDDTTIHVTVDNRGSDAVRDKAIARARELADQLGRTLDA